MSYSYSSGTITALTSDRTFVGIYYTYENYMCTQGPVILDLVNPAFIVLSSFWTVTILATIGMKFAAAYKGERPVFIRGYIWLISRISRSILYRILFHGTIFALSTAIPLAIKIKALVAA